MKILSRILTLFIILAFLTFQFTTIVGAESSSSKNKKDHQPNFIERLFKTQTKGQVKGVKKQVAQNTQKPTNPQPDILQRVWSFITAPFNALLNLINPPAPSKTPQPSPGATSTATPPPSPATETSTDAQTSITSVGTSVGTSVESGGLTITSLGAGTTYIDLIGKTVIDSFGNVYPSSEALTATTKPTLGTSSNKYYGLNLNQFTISKDGDITTVLPGGIVKVSSKGVLSSSKVDINSADVTGTLQGGAGGTGNTTYTVGDMLYSATTGTLSRLGIGSSGQILSALGGIPAWSSSLDLSGNVGIGASLTVTGLTYSSGGLRVNGFSDLTGNVGVGGSLTVTSLSRFSSSILGISGSSTAPAFSFINSTSTGLFSPSSNALSLVTNGAGTPAFNITAAGLVGIGITSPSQTFQVNSGASSTVINSSGNVGIGTTSPNSAFSLVGGGVIGTGYGSLIAPTSGLLIEGRVGIGTTAPASALSVSGNLGVGGTSAGAAYNLEIWGTGRLTGALTVDGNLGVGASITSDSVARLNTLRVTGFSDLAGNVGVGTSLTSTSAIYGLAGLRIAGVSDFTGNVGIGTSLNATATDGLLNTRNLNVLGTSSLSTAFGSTLTISGNTGVGASLTTTGLDYATGGLRVNGFSDLTGNVGVGGSLTVTSLSRFSSSILGISGSSTAPAFSFINSTSTGLFSPSSNALSLVTNGAGTPAFNITAAGLVGIGITSPSQTFQVNSGASSTVINSSGNVGIGVTTANSALAVSGGGVFGSGYAGMTAPTNGLLVQGNVGIGTSAPAALLTIGETLGSQLRIASNGNVGIGVTTNSPLAPLHVSGQSFFNGNVGIGTSAPAALLTVGGGASSQFLVSQEGNVGIGITTPLTAYKLDVGGGVRASAGFNGNCLNTTSYGNLGNCNQDVAEIYSSSEDVEPGDVLSVDSAGHKLLKKSSGGYDPNLIGIVSTSPGLILGIRGEDVILGGESTNYSKNADTKKPAVALAGKVPVKVSLENGPIKVGDYLTSSSIAGVAMKATKAGMVIGEALESYSGEEVGSVTVFVRLGYFNGVKIADVLDQNALADLSSNFSQLVLARLLSERLTLKQSNASELLTDTIAAGVEVITPQLTANNVATGLIRPLDEGNLTLGLKSTQAFNITNEDNESVISFDSQGNAYFKGTVVAAAVKADSIEGLRVLADAIVTSKISSLLDQKISQATSSAAVAGVSSQSPTLDANVLVKLNADGGLTVGGTAEFKAQSIFTALSEFISNAIFRGDVSFLGRIFLPKDATGVALIKSGSDVVTVSFARAYDSSPAVNVTPTNYAGNDGAGNSILTGDVRFVVQGLSGAGFTIKLNKAAPADMVFSWTALAQSNSFTSNTTASTPIEVAPSSTPAPSATSAPSATPAPGATPEPTATPEPSATPAPGATPEPTATPEPSATPQI